MSIEIANCQRELRVPRKKIAELVGDVLSARGLPDAGVSVAIVDSRAIRALNRSFLGRDRATDVIAFPLSDSTNPEADLLLGEIVVSAQRACHTAAWRKGSAQAELLLYVVHGLLHLLGMTDDTATQAALMHSEALRILRQHRVRGVT